MAGFGGSVKLTGEEAYRAALKSIAANLKEVAAQQKLTAAQYDKSDNSLAAISARSKDLQNKLTAQKEKYNQLNKAVKDYTNQVNNEKKQLQALQNQLDQEKTKLEQIAKQYGTNSKEYQTQAKVVDTLEKQVKELNAQYDAHNTTLTKTRADLTSTEAAMKTTTNQIQKLGKQAEEAGQGAGKLGNAVEDSGNKAEKAGRGGYTVFKNVLANLATQVTTRLIDGMKKLGAAVVDAGTNFDSAMAKVQAVSGASAEDMEKLTAKAKEMGETTKFSAAESAEALNYMAMAGWKTEDMLNGLSGIMDLAAASGSDLAITSDIVTDALTAMGYSASDAGRLADVMAAASSNANTNVEMMGETFKYAASVAGSLGYSMEDVALATGLMANAGVKGERAGTALRAVMQRLATDTGDAATTMHKMGVETTNADGTMRPLGDVMKDLRKAMSKLTDEQKTATAKTIAGTEAMGGLLAIVNASETDYNKLTDAIKNSTGAAAKMADTMQNNVGGKMTKLRSQLEGIYLTIWRKLEPVISKTIDSISKSLRSVDWSKFGENAGKALEKVAQGFQWLLENKDLVINGLKAMLAAFAVAKIADFTKGLSDSLGITTLVTTAQKALTTATVAQTAAQGAATTATTVGTTAMKIFNAALAANPIGLVVTALGLLAGGMMLATNAINDNNSASKQSAKRMKELREQVDDATSSWNDLQAAQKKQLDNGMTEIGYYRGLANELKAITDENGKVQDGYEARAQFITTTLSDALGTEIKLQDGVIQGYDKLQSSIEETLKKKQAELILEAQQASYNEAILKRQEAYKTLMETSQELTEAESQLKRAQEESTKAQQSGNLIWQWIAQNDLETAQARYNGLLTTYKDQTALVQEYTYNVATYEDNMAKFHEGKYDEMATATWDYVKEFQSAGDAQKAQLESDNKIIESALDFNKRQYEKTGNEIYKTEAKRLQDQLNANKESLKQYNATTENELKNNGKKWLDNAATTLSKLSDKKVEFKKTADGMVQMYVDGIAEGKPVAESKAEEIAKGVLKDFDKKADAEGVGKDVITGFTNGEGNFSLQNAAFRTARSFASNILSNLKEKLGIGSPSRFTKQYGKWLLQGLGIGMEKEQDTIIDQAGEFGDNVLGAIDGALDKGISTNALEALKTAIPTEFDASIGVNASRMAEAAQTGEKSLIAYFKEALSQMKIEMDDQEFGKFVDKTVTKLVYN